MGLRDLITKDVKSENESKQAMVALRVLYLTVLIAFVIDLLIAGSELFRLNAAKIFGFLAAIVVLFIGTYYSKTKTALFLFMLFLFLWILEFIPCFGWSAGLQNYFILVLMMLFFASYGRPAIKFVNAGFVLVIRIITIMLYGKVGSQIEMTLLTDKLMQITNISAVFLGIIFMSYMFSQKDNEEESKLMKYNDFLKKEAYTDQLTGHFTRRRAMEYIKTVREEYPDKPISIAIGDIDFFKKVNDTYGHDMGDEVLKDVAKIMVDACGKDAFLARWGGEEFLMVFPDCNGDDAYAHIEDVRRTIQKTAIRVGGNEIHITMTMGLAEYDFNSDLQSTIKEADDKLYTGKANGRNQVVY